MHILDVSIAVLRDHVSFLTPDALMDERKAQRCRKAGCFEDSVELGRSWPDVRAFPLSSASFSMTECGVV